MGRIAEAYRKETGYTGNVGPSSMSKEEWNDYCKFASKWRNTSPEHIADIKERKKARELARKEKLNDPLYKLHSKIKVYYVKYCNDITNVVNFESAKKDRFYGWDLHHINGEKMTVAELKKAGLYFNRPADEFIFLKHDEHIRRHQIIKSNNTIQRAKNMIENGEKMIEKGKKMLLEAKNMHIFLKHW